MINYTLIYGLILLGLTVFFLIHTYLTREPIEKMFSFKEYFSDWLKSHDQEDRPPEEMSGPLVPYSRRVYGISKFFVKLGFTPNKMTIFSFLVGLYSIVFYLLGSYFLIFAGFSIFFSGILDSVDGCIATILNKGTKFGAYFDAVMDKFGDIVWGLGPIIYLLLYSELIGPFFLNVYGPFVYIIRYFDIYNISHFNLFIGLGLLTIGTTLIQEYCRARQQGLDIERTPMVVGERIWRLLFMSVFIIEMGFSFLNHFSPMFQEGILYDIHIWVSIWSIPTLIIILFLLSIISIIQFSVHGKRNLDSTE